MDAFCNFVWLKIEHAAHHLLFFPIEMVYMKSWWRGAADESICERLSNGVPASHWASTPQAQQQCLIMIQRDLDSIVTLATISTVTVVSLSAFQQICYLLRRWCESLCCESRGDAKAILTVANMLIEREQRRRTLIAGD